QPDRCLPALRTRAFNRGLRTSALGRNPPRAPPTAAPETPHGPTRKTTDRSGAFPDGSGALFPPPRPNARTPLTFLQPCPILASEADGEEVPCPPISARSPARSPRPSFCPATPTGRAGRRRRSSTALFASTRCGACSATRGHGRATG